MPDAIVIGCGGGGAVVAKELSEAGRSVLVLEAGPWLRDPDTEFSRLPHDMNSIIDGKFRWGPSDRTKPPWVRRRDGVWLVFQVAGVGGTTLHYNGISARAYPEAINDAAWPVSYRDLIEPYEQVESFLPVIQPSNMARKDALFAEGCEAAGIKRNDSKDVSDDCWKPSYNAILPIADMSAGLEWPEADGCTMCGHCINGCSNPAGAPIERKAKRSTNVSYVPAAVATGRCEISPDSFVTRIETQNENASRVTYRDSTGETHTVEAGVVVLAAGTVETPRLWLNSDLPNTHDQVGRCFTTHLQDTVFGIFDREVHQDVGQVTMARADFPGNGCLWSQGQDPQIFAVTIGGAGKSFYDGTTGGPWDSEGRLVGKQAARFHDAFSRTLCVLVCVDDEPHPENRVMLDPDYGPDENGRVPLIYYRPTPRSEQRREFLARKATEVLRAAGAKHVHRSNLDVFVTHPMGTMRMGSDPRSSVVDESCESHEVKRLFIADNSVFANGLGGPNPTLTCQALATRTAAAILKRYL